MTAIHRMGGAEERYTRLTAQLSAGDCRHNGYA